MPVLFARPSARPSKVAKPRALRRQQLGQVVADVAVAAEHLHGVVGDVERQLRRTGRSRAWPRASRPRPVELPRGLPGEQARGVDLDRHLGEHEGDRLLLRDRRRRRPRAPWRSRARTRRRRARRRRRAPRARRARARSRARGRRLRRRRGARRPARARRRARAPPSAAPGCPCSTRASPRGPAASRGTRKSCARAAVVGAHQHGVAAREPRHQASSPVEHEARAVALAPACAGGRRRSRSRARAARARPARSASRA